MPMPRKPNELHALEGTGRADRGTTTLVEIKGALAESPQLRAFEDGIDRQEVFEMLRGFVNQVTGQAKIDELLLSNIVDCYELYCMAKAVVVRDGIFDDRGYQSHAIKIMNDQLANIHKLMREHGLTPATRGAVKASNQLEIDPLDSIMMGPK